MPYLALVLFTPWFAILSWVYWTFPKSLPASSERRRFDIAALLVSVTASGAAMVWSYYQPFEGVGLMWPQVIATLAAYHVFLVLIVLAWLLRGRRFKPSDGAGAAT